MSNFLKSKIPASFILAAIEFFIEKRFYRIKQIPVQDVYTFERVNYLNYFPNLKPGDIQKIKRATIFLKEQIHHLDVDIARQIYGIYIQSTKTSFWQQPQPEGFLNLDHQDPHKDRIALILHTHTIQKFSDKELNALISVELARLDLHQPLEKIYIKQQLFEFNKKMLLACIGLLIHEAIQYDFYRKESPEFLLIIAIILVLNSIHKHYKKILQHHQYQADEKSLRFSNDADALINVLKKKDKSSWLNLFEHSTNAQREHHIKELELKLA